MHVCAYQQFPCHRLRCSNHSHDDTWRSPGLITITPDLSIYQSGFTRAVWNVDSSAPHLVAAVACRPLIMASQQAMSRSPQWAFILSKRGLGYKTLPREKGSSPIAPPPQHKLPETQISHGTSPEFGSSYRPYISYLVVGSRL